MSHHASLGGLGIAIGVVVGYAIHTLHVSTEQPDGAVLPVVWELSLHSVGAGLVIGAVYATMPTLGPMLGVAIVSHKAPAGYAAARRLARQGHSAWVLVMPAAAVGIAALIVGIVDPPTPDGLHALVFGGATGLFLHVAVDFLPRCHCEVGLHSTTGTGKKVGARSLRWMRWEAIGSTLLGGGLVVTAWGLL
jgi:ZIP family zinc transporter